MALSVVVQIAEGTSINDMLDLLLKMDGTLRVTAIETASEYNGYGDKIAAVRLGMAHGAD